VSSEEEPHAEALNGQRTAGELKIEREKELLAPRYTDPSSLRVYSGGQGAVTGKVAKIYRTDGDASDSHAVVTAIRNTDFFRKKCHNKA
jgi:hypothetical protein